MELAAHIHGLVADTGVLLNRALDNGESVLFEGAQGTMLDIDHGTYPYVTSSNATSGGVATGLGVAPTRIRGVVGVTKAYTTRVGSGPFPTEMPDLDAQALRERGKEFGAVTGRPRRCGWLDLVVLKYAKMLSGIDSLVVTKMDVYDTQPEIKVCTGYRYKGKMLENMPADVETLTQVGAGVQNAARMAEADAGHSRREGIAGSGAQLSEFYFRAAAGGDRNDFHRAGTRRNHCSARHQTRVLALRRHAFLRSRSRKSD